MTQTVLFLKHPLTRIKQIQLKDTQATFSAREVFPISQLDSVTLYCFLHVVIFLAVVFAMFELPVVPSL